MMLRTRVPSGRTCRSSSERDKAAFTWVEALVAIAVIGVLAALAMPRISCGPVRADKTQTLSNLRQLYTATFAMAMDGQTTGDKSLGWPGDTGGTFSNWANQIVSADYLKTDDVCKLLSAPGVKVPAGKIPTRMSEAAVLVYAVSSNSVDDAVFLTSANFTNTPRGGDALLKTAKPYGDTGFVVFRKGGDGSIYKKGQVGQTNIIGSYVPLVK